MSVCIRKNSLVLTKQLKRMTTGRGSPTVCNPVYLRPAANGFRTSFRFYGDSNEARLVSHVEKKVKSYGYLELSNLDLDVKIKPACPNLYPNMDRAICNFYSETEMLPPKFNKVEEKLSLQVDKAYPPKENYCRVEVPIKYDVDSANILGQNSVELESLESGSIRITTGSGDITSKSIKGDFISLLSQSGNVKCLGLSQGRITIHSGSGDIHGHKFQGPSLKVATMSGNITAESIYSDMSYFVSATGNITLKNLHRKCDVKITGSGNLTASGMDGSLDAQLGQGRHQIQISRLQENSSVRIVQGSLKLKVPEDCPFGIRVTARSIVVPEKMRIGRLVTADDSCSFEYRTEDAGAIIEIEGKSSEVVIENEDWFASLGLGFK